MTNYRSLILLYDRLFWGSAYRTFVMDHYNAADETPFEEYQLLDITDFETLVAWNVVTPMKELLDLSARYPVTTTSGFPTHGVMDFVEEYAAKKQLSKKHPLLEQVAAEFFDSLGVNLADETTASNQTQ